MAEFKQHAPGTFCWIELGTNDQEAAKKFYTKLFGWTVNDVPIGEGETYTMFQKGGRDIGAAYRLDPQRQPGVPPHWGSYVAVKSVDDAVAKAKKLGAEVIVEPFDVFDSGRMAVMKDPAGAVISVWQAKEHIGVGRRDEPGTLCWNELATGDTEKATKFYTALFGWKAEVQQMPAAAGGTMSYTVFQLDGAPAAGMFRITDEMGPLPPNWGMYVAVEDCDATVKKAESLGARTCLEPMDIPTVGRFAALSDPQGAMFSVIRPEPQG